MPNLGVTLLSIKQHMKYRGCYFHAENDHVILAYPKTILEVQTEPEFSLTITPAKHTTAPYVFDEESAIFTTNSDRRTYKILNQQKARLISTHKGKLSLASTVRVKKLLSHVKLPKRATSGSIGFDACMAHPVTLAPNAITKIYTGLAMQVPDNHYLRIAPRSSLSLKGISIEAGVVDSDYRSEIVILAQNNTIKPIKIQEGQKAAQFIFEQASTPCMVLSTSLDDTFRNKGGLEAPTAPNHTAKPTKKKL